MKSGSRGAPPRPPAWPVPASGCAVPRAGAFGENALLPLERQLGDDRRDIALRTVRDRLSNLSPTAAGEADTPERSQARRVLAQLTRARPSAFRIADI